MVFLHYHKKSHQVFFQKTLLCAPKNSLFATPLLKNSHPTLFFFFCVRSVVIVGGLAVSFLPARFYLRPARSLNTKSEVKEVDSAVVVANRKVAVTRQHFINPKWVVKIPRNSSCPLEKREKSMKIKQTMFVDDIGTTVKSLPQFLFHPRR